MGRIREVVHVKFVESSSSFVSFVVRLLSGCVIGFTLAIIGDEIIGYSNLLFTFVVVSVIGIFLRVTKKWAVMIVLLFDLLMVAMGLLLKLYILRAP